jgi:hypothetical protein
VKRIAARELDLHLNRLVHFLMSKDVLKRFGDQPLGKFLAPFVAWDSKGDLFPQLIRRIEREAVARYVARRRRK